MASSSNPHLLYSADSRPTRASDAAVRPYTADPDTSIALHRYTRKKDTAADWSRRHEAYMLMKHTSVDRVHPLADWHTALIIWCGIRITPVYSLSVPDFLLLDHRVGTSTEYDYMVCIIFLMSSSSFHLMISYFLFFFQISADGPSLF